MTVLAFVAGVFVGWLFSGSGHDEFDQDEYNQGYDDGVKDGSHG